MRWGSTESRAETETRRAIWYVVEEIYRGWRVSPTPATVGTSVNGILVASYDFWYEDEDEDGSPDHSRRGAGMAGDHSASAHARCSGARVVRWGTNCRSYCRWGLRRQGRLLRRCGRPIHYVRHVSDEIEVTILLLHLTPGR